MKQFDCDVYLDMMPLVKDGAASPATRQAVEEHLAACANCRRVFADLLDAPEQQDMGESETFQKIRRGVKSRLRLAAFLLVLVCLIPTAWYAVWSGNPFSEAFIRRQSQKYLAEHYPGNDFVVSEPRYSMKSMGYTVSVSSPSSIDTEFVLTYDYFGGDFWDGYESYVASGTNTFSRISEEVRALVEPELNDIACVSVSLNSDWPSIYDEYGYPFEGDRILEIGTLEIDGKYDPVSMSRIYARVEISTEVTNASAGEISKILREVYVRLAAKDLAVSTVDVTVWDENSSMTIAGFPFVDIPGDALETRVEAAADAWKIFQQEYEAWLAEKNGA